MGDRGDARQCLPAKTERRDGGEILRAPDLAGRVALDGQLGVRRSHSLAVILDADQPFAAQLQGHRYAHGARVESVLDQLLDCRRGALDHLAGCNLVGKPGRQPVDLAHGRC